MWGESLQAIYRLSISAETATLVFREMQIHLNLEKPFKKEELFLTRNPQYISPKDMEGLVKIRPYDRSTLWRSAFAERENDPDKRDRQALADAYSQLRDRAGILVNEIHAALPHLTVHDLTHADTLWDVASAICGPTFTLNPLEAFVLGAGFLLHDAGMALAVYPGGLGEVKTSLQWRDAVVSAWKRRGVEDPSGAQRDNPAKEICDEATFQVLRARHAAQARSLATALWAHPSTGRPLALVQNDDLLESYGLLIGNIAASHHWPLPEVSRYFGEPTPASAAWPREWEVDSLLLACILRCADACAIDETRAPSLLFAIRQPTNESRRHWNFQNRIFPAKRRQDGLIFESKAAFQSDEADDWWLCFDAIEIADRELRGSDGLLTDRKRQPLAVRRVVGAGDPDILVQFVKVEGWRPVNTLPKISDPGRIIERLGGKQLYGDDPVVPVREMIQNSVDAIRARRFLDPHFHRGGTSAYPGQILLRFENIPETDDCWIVVEDNGIGMSESTISRSLLDFGTSFWSSSIAAELYPGLPSERKFKPIGRFGIGFFSVFMYASVVVVMSREFRSSPNSWNVLSFGHGVRGRANLSNETLPGEIKLVEASTRIKFRVSKSYIGQLARADSVGRHETGSSSEEQRIVRGMKDLTSPLDVAVQFSFFDSETISLNQPLIYEKGLDAIWEIANNGGDETQKNMLCPMGGGQHDLYGYCGVSLNRYPNSLIKSIGGLGRREMYGRKEELSGIAEYNVTSASRMEGTLAAPQVVIDIWAKRQMELIMSLPLSVYERQAAANNLGVLVSDVRPVFLVETSIGALDLDCLVKELRARRSAIVPVLQSRSPFSDEDTFFRCRRGVGRN